MTFTPSKILNFRYENKSVSVRIPKDICEEVSDFSCPTNYKDDRPTFLYDFLTFGMFLSCEKENGLFRVKEDSARVGAFSWVEIKPANPI